MPPTVNATILKYPERTSTVPTDAAFYTVIGGVDYHVLFSTMYSQVKTNIASDTITVGTLATTDLRGINGEQIVVGNNMRFAEGTEGIFTEVDFNITANTLTFTGIDINLNGTLKPERVQLSQTTRIEAPAADATLDLADDSHFFVSVGLVTDNTWYLRLPATAATGMTCIIATDVNATGDVRLLDGADTDDDLGSVPGRSAVMVRKFADRWQILSKYSNA